MSGAENFDVYKSEAFSLGLIFICIKLLIPLNEYRIKNLNEIREQLDKEETLSSKIVNGLICEDPQKRFIFSDALDLIYPE